MLRVSRIGLPCMARGSIVSLSPLWCRGLNTLRRVPDHILQLLACLHPREDVCATFNHWIGTIDRLCISDEIRSKSRICTLFEVFHLSAIRQGFLAFCFLVWFLQTFLGCLATRLDWAILVADLDLNRIDFVDRYGIVRCESTWPRSVKLTM